MPAAMCQPIYAEKYSSGSVHGLFLQDFAQSRENLDGTETHIRMKPGL